jgi:hypothetical protein
MSATKLEWNDGDRQSKAAFTIEYVGRVNIEVESGLPGSGAGLSREERRALALRHAKLLVRNLANALERQVH